MYCNNIFPALSPLNKIDIDRAQSSSMSLSKLADYMMSSACTSSDFQSQRLIDLLIKHSLIVSYKLIIMFSGKCTDYDCILYRF